ncbi:TPA: SGNH/GDSL hydrolase family protein, partial [Klebsiella pneumoniae]|nr:SGNH/GDSL hydrolase family protein [Klebsiella pneumoniae]
MALNPPLGNTSPEVLLDNAKRLDELVNGPAATVPDRADVPLDSWRQIMAMVAAAIIEAQNSITAIGLPFTDEAEVQAAADDGKIPVGAVAWVRSTDGGSLADEYMNVAGTMTATGRKMPSQLSYEA